MATLFPLTASSPSRTGAAPSSGPRTRLPRSTTPPRLAWTASNATSICRVTVCPIVIHDATLDRTTSGIGAVSARTAAELGAIDAGAKFGEAAGYPFRDSGHGVPKLADLLDRHLDIPIVVEIKGDDPKVVPAVISTLRASRRPGRCMVGGFSRPVLDAVRQMAPEFPTGASREEVKAAIRRSYLRIPPRRSGYALFQVPFMFHGKQIFHAPFVRTVTRAGVGVQAWIIDEEADMRRLIQWGVTGLISDRPDVAVRVVRR